MTEIFAGVCRFFNFINQAPAVSKEQSATTERIKSAGAKNDWRFLFGGAR